MPEARIRHLAGCCVADVQVPYRPLSFSREMIKRVLEGHRQVSFV